MAHGRGGTPGSDVDVAGRYQKHGRLIQAAARLRPRDTTSHLRSEGGVDALRAGAERLAQEWRLRAD